MKRRILFVAAIALLLTAPVNAGVNATYNLTWVSISNNTDSFYLNTDTSVTNATLNHTNWAGGGAAPCPGSGNAATASYYPMDTSGNDSAGNVDVCHLHSPVGSALAENPFNNSGGYIGGALHGNRTNLSYGHNFLYTDWTIEAWLRGNSSADLRPWSMYGDTSGFTCRGINELICGTRKDGPWTWLPAVALPINEWHHFRIRGNASGAQIWRDNVLMWSDTTVNWSWNYINQPHQLLIGYDIAGEAYWSGDIDELRIYPNSSHTANNTNTNPHPETGPGGVFYINTSINGNANISYNGSAPSPNISVGSNNITSGVNTMQFWSRSATAGSALHDSALAFNYSNNVTETITDNNGYIWKNATVDTNNSSAATYTLLFPHRYSLFNRTVIRNGIEIPASAYTFTDGGAGGTLTFVVALTANATNTLRVLVNFEMLNVTARDETSNAAIAVFSASDASASGVARTSPTKNGCQCIVFNGTDILNNALNTIYVWATDYANKTYEVSLSSSYNLTAYLLATASGSYVAFRTVSGTGVSISGALVTAQRTIGGTLQLVEQDYTDASGAVTFFLSSQVDYTISAAASGYQTYTAIIKPIFTSYTLTLTTSATVTAPLSDVTWYVYVGANNTLYNRSQSLISLNASSPSGRLAYWSISANLNGTQLGTNNSTAPGGGSIWFTTDLSAATQQSVVNVTVYLRSSEGWNTSRNLSYPVRALGVGDTRLSSLHGLLVGLSGSGLSEITKGLFASIFILIVLVMVNRYLPLTGFGAGVFGLGFLAFFTYAGWFSVNLFIVVSLLVVGIFVLKKGSL